MILHFFEDALFSAIAAIGFAAISHPPKRAYAYYALIAACGHSLRFILMNMSTPMTIVPATLIASFTVGILAVFLSPLSKTPAETCLFPALLPMIPGIYAYKAFAGLALCVLGESPDAFSHYFIIAMHNGLTCISILLCMVTGGSVPMFIFKKVSFQATR